MGLSEEMSAAGRDLVQAAYDGGFNEGRKSLAMDLFCWLGAGAMDRIHKFDPELLTELQDILRAARGDR